MNGGVNYKSIPGFDNYLVGDDGSVWSKTTKRIIAQEDTREYGHLRVSLWNGNKRHRFYVHRLVLTVFVGPCPEGMECRHLNGDASDNRLENLRWGTSKENSEDTARLGRKNRGDRNGMSKISDEVAVRIIGLYRSGMRVVDIHRKIGVSYSIAYSICSGKSWKHIA